MTAIERREAAIQDILMTYGYNGYAWGEDIKPTAEEIAGVIDLLKSLSNTEWWRTGIAHWADLIGRVKEEQIRWAVHQGSLLRVK